MNTLKVIFLLLVPLNLILIFYFWSFYFYFSKLLNFNEDFYKGKNGTSNSTLMIKSRQIIEPFKCIPLSNLGKNVQELDFKFNNIKKSNNEIIPILIYYSHVSENIHYLNYVTKVALESNSLLILIVQGILDGTNILNSLDKRITVIKLKPESYFNYQHISSLSVKFELSGFNRWFAFAQATQNLPFNTYFVSNTDVLILTNVTKDYNCNFFNCDLYISKENFNSIRISPHASYWKKDTLIKFANYIKDTYKDVKSKKKIFDLYRTSQKLPLKNSLIATAKNQDEAEGINDAALLGLFLTEYGFKLKVCNNMDFKFNSSIGYHSHNIIDFNFIQNRTTLLPYFTKNQTNYRLKSLHFKGEEIAIKYISKCLN